MKHELPRRDQTRISGYGFTNVDHQHRKFVSDPCRHARHRELAASRNARRDRTLRARVGGGRRAGAAPTRVRHDAGRDAVPRRSLVGWQGEEHQRRSRCDQGREGRCIGSRGACAHGRALRDGRQRAGGCALSALRAAFAAGAHELPAAPGRGPRGFVAQGRHAPARRCLPVAAQSRRADPARVLQRQSPRRRPRVARRRDFRVDGAPAVAARAPDVSRRSADAGGAARHQGTAERIRPPDARAPRSREGRRCIPGQLRAARSPLCTRHDMDLLFGSGDARGDVGSIHARADDASAPVGAVRACAFAVGHPRADHRRCLA